MSTLPMAALGVASARMRLAADRWTAAARRRPRVLATACWTFPIYSQTFVYEELTQLLGAGFEVRLLYAELTGRDQIPDAFRALWHRRRRTHLDPERAWTDVEHYRRVMPSRVDAVLGELSAATSLDRDGLLAHPHVRMAFSYARLAEAYRPDWLHSYFFYEGSLFTLVASRLLGIPRGVSCYADHMLDDYALKVVPLHLATSGVVVATSERIREELLALHPEAGRANVIVKPNAIDTERFPVVARGEPAPGEPYHLVCVSRLEPKKGLLDLVDAVALLVERGRRVVLHLVGDTDDPAPAAVAYREQLRERIAVRSLAEVVRLEGRQPAAGVLTFLGRSHIFVAPFVELENGDKDGIPTALLEGMSTGIPVVTTDSGSITEPIAHDVTGIVVAQRDPRALADAVEALFEDRPRRARLGAAAARAVRERYDVRACDRVLHARMREVIQGSRPAGAA